MTEYYFVVENADGTSGCCDGYTNYGDCAADAVWYLCNVPGVINVIIKEIHK